MNIMEWKTIRRTLLGIEADRYALNDTDIIHGTLFIKVSQGDMPGLLINVDRCDRCRYLLNQGQMIFQIDLVSSIDKIF